MTEVKSTIPSYFNFTNEKISDEFNQENKFFGESDRERADRKESSLRYKTIEHNIKRYAIKAEQRRKSLKNGKEIRPLLQLQLSRLEFAMKTLYETKIRNFLLLEKRKWEDFVFDLVKSKINGRQDWGQIPDKSTLRSHNPGKSSMDCSLWTTTPVPWTPYCSVRFSSPCCF